MIANVGAATPHTAGPSQDAKLRQSAQHLEGIFVQEMYKAMRETIPSDGPFGGGSGEQMFTGMLDGKIAADTPARWQHGLSDAIYKSLRHALPGAAASDAVQAAVTDVASAPSTPTGALPDVSHASTRSTEP
jgi:flagellar protein FlgJ